jgi:predicted permease
MAFPGPFLEALRQRRRDWRVTLGFSVVLGSALALAITCLSVAWPLLFGRLPFRSADRVRAVESMAKGQAGGISWQDADDLRKRVASIEKIAVYGTRTWGVQTERGGHVEVLLSATATDEFLEVLGAGPALRDPSEIWLTHAGAARLFGATEQAAGRTIWVNAAPYRVAGVLDASFRLPLAAGEPEMVIPLSRAEYCCSRGGVQQAIALTHDPERFADEVAAASGRLAEEFPATNRDRRFVTMTLRRHLFGSRVEALQWMLWGVLCLVLIAAGNGAGIWMARWVRGRRETAIRMALGAPHGRLAAMRAWEGAISGIGAAAVGTVLATLLMGFLRSMPILRERLEAFAVWQPVGLSGEAVAAAGVFALACGMATALLPHLVVMRRPTVGAATLPNRARVAATALQLALTAVLAWTTVAVGENAWRLLTAPRGFSTDSTLIAGIGVPEARYDTDEKMIGFHNAVTEQLRSISGVSAAAGGVAVPQGSARTRFLRDGQTLERERQPVARIGVADARLLPLFGIPVRRGRGFTAQDRWTAPRVALVNEAFVRTFLADSPDPLREGLRLSFYNGFAMKPYTRFQVVGVVADTRNDAMLLEAQPQVLIPATQIAMEGYFYYVRTGLPAASAQRELREAIWRVDPGVQRVTFRRLEDHLGRGLTDRRAAGAFGLLLWCVAAVLVGGGLYASLSTVLMESRKELAIKAAIGASPWRLAADALRWALWSVALGGGAAAVAIPFLAANVHLEKAVLAPTPVNVLVTAVAMAAITMAAALRPVSNAARVSPAQAMRET